MNVLSPTELSQLSEFRFVNHHYPSKLSCRVSDLLVEGRLQEFIEAVKERIKTSDDKVAASMFSKRYGFFAALSLYSMTILGKSLNMSLDNVSIETDDSETEWYWTPKFRFDSLEGKPVVDNRELWREEVIQSLFSNNIFPFIEALAKGTKLSKQILWENIAIYIFWLYESLLEDEKYEAHREIILDDFHYLLEKAPGESFGPYHKNPLTRFYHKKQLIPLTGQLVRVRKTCCLYYKIDETGERCKGCPISCKSAK